jgi:hypothetical protein
MNRQFNLTTQEKIMNIAKLGIVSAAMNHPAKATKPNNGGLYRVIIYTLCAGMAYLIVLRISLKNAIYEATSLKLNSNFKRCYINITPEVEDLAPQH